MYSVDLGLSREQVKQLRQLALDCDLPVRGLVTKLVITAIVDNEAKKSGTRVKSENKIKK